MKTNAELDKWSAEKVGLTVYVHQNGKIKILTIPKDWEFDQGEWTLSDARCREVVRECFKITTCENWDEEANERWMAFQHGARNIRAFTGDLIEAAEIACIQAIKDAEGE